MQWPPRRIASRLPVSRECIANRGSRRLRSVDVIHVLSDLFILRVVSGHVRSDMVRNLLQSQCANSIAAVGAKTAHIMAGSPCENMA
jgi:putative transposase